MCVDKKRLPCSSLHQSNCEGENNKYCQLNNNNCMINPVKLSLMDFSDMNNLENSISSFNDISGAFDNLMETK